MNFSNKKVLVCGMARSGRAASLLLAKLGAMVVAQDIKKDIVFPELDSFILDSSNLDSSISDSTILDSSNTISLYLGKNPDDIITTFDLVVISPGIPYDIPFLEKARAAGIPVWGEIELAYKFCPSPIIAITGTNGKTTVTTLVGEILNRYNSKTVVVGNIGKPFCENVETLTPDNCVVVEVSSFQLETTFDFAPKVSAVLNLTPDHLDRHKTMDIYQYTKERIFANQSPGDFAVLGYDNAITRGMRPPCNTIFFSAKEQFSEKGVFLDNGIIKANISGIDFNGNVIEYKNAKIVDIAHIKILPENALAACALCLCSGVPPEVIAEGLVNFKGVEHRIEYVTTKNNIEFYNDSKATNTDSAIKGLEAMSRPVILIAGGYDKDADFSGWVNAFQDNQKHENLNQENLNDNLNKVKFLIVLGETADQIIETCQTNNFKDYQKVSNLKDAVQLAYKKAKPGDSVLLSPACASWDMFENFEQRGNLFKGYVWEI